MVKTILKKVKKALGGGKESATSTQKSAPAEPKGTNQPKKTPKQTAAKPAAQTSSTKADANKKPQRNPSQAQNAKSDRAKGREGRPPRKQQPRRRQGQAKREPDNADELLSTVKASRAKQTEEWRPSRSEGAAPGGEASSDGQAEKGRNSRQRSRNRGGRDSNRRQDGQSSGQTQAAPENRKSEASDDPKPRSRGNRGGRGRGGRRQDGERGERPAREGQSRKTRGKGFSFPRPKPEHGDWDPTGYDVPVEEGKTRFHDLDMPAEIMHAIADLGYQYCTPIQAGILPELLKGRDGIGQAQTGTGKTAAFLLASLTRMLRNPLENPKNGSPRVLILAPTRELVLQIEEEAAELFKYTPIQTLPVYGGLDYEPQKEALRNNVVDLVVATPGRLLDFLRSKVINLREVETLVLDEADRMLDMGFIPDVKRIVYATPHKDQRQTLFFSATFTDDVRRLADSWTRDPFSLEIEPENVAADTVEQTVYIVTENDKFALVVNLLRDRKPKRCLIFANRRDRSQDLCDRLKDYEFSAALLTGAVAQAKRVKVLEQFKNGDLTVLVATDVAGRGIHVDDVDLVINFNLPEDAEDYVHRIGRTGRAGSEGQSICFACEFDSMMIPEIETYLGRSLSCTHPEHEWLEVEDRPRVHKSKPAGRAGGGRPSGGGRGGPRGGRPRGRGPRRR